MCFKSVVPGRTVSGEGAGSFKSLQLDCWPCQKLKSTRSWAFSSIWCTNAFCLLMHCIMILIGQLLCRVICMSPSAALAVEHTYTTGNQPYHRRRLLHLPCPFTSKEKQDAYLTETNSISSFTMEVWFSLLLIIGRNKEEWDLTHGTLLWILHTNIKNTHFNKSLTNAYLHTIPSSFVFPVKSFLPSERLKEPRCADSLLAWRVLYLLLVSTLHSYQSPYLVALVSTCCGILPFSPTSLSLSITSWMPYVWC